MRNCDFPNILGAITVAALLASGNVIADDPKSTDPESADAEQSATLNLPEPVARLVDASSGVQRVEAMENGKFAIHREILEPGSRLKRDVTMLVAEDGSVVDWGRTPMLNRQYTQRELYDAGQLDLAEALDQLDPRIQRGDGR